MWVSTLGRNALRSYLAVGRLDCPELAPAPGETRGGCCGVIGPDPSTTLDKKLAIQLSLNGSTFSVRESILFRLAQPVELLFRDIGHILICAARKLLQRYACTGYSKIAQRDSGPSLANGIL